MEYKDYYATLGVPKTRDAGRDQEGLPQAGPRAPSRYEQGPRCREALQGGERGAGRPDRSGEAEAVRRARRELAGVPAGRLRLRWSDRLGRLRRRPGWHALDLPIRAARGDGRLQRLLPGLLRRRGGCGGGSPFGTGSGGFEYVDLSDLGGSTRTRTRSIPSAQATAEVTPGRGRDRGRADGERQRPAPAREDPRRRARWLEGQAERGGRRRRPRHQRQRQARSSLRAARHRTCAPSCRSRSPKPSSAARSRSPRPPAA